jgi:hypothetical protein
MIHRERALVCFVWMVLGTACGGEVAGGLGAPGDSVGPSSGSHGSTSPSGAPIAPGGAAGQSGAGGVDAGAVSAGPASGPGAVVGSSGAPSGSGSNAPGSSGADSGGPPPKSQAAVVTLASAQTCPWGMAIDATNVYWTDCGDPTGGYVLKVPKAGGEVVTLASGDRLSGIAVDDTNVYWVAGTSDGSSGAIMKVPVGGGTPTTLATRPGAPAHLVVDASYAYWVELVQGVVMKVPLSGGAPVGVASAPSGFQIALGDTDVYWLGGEGLMKAPKAGGTAVGLTSEFPAFPTASLAVSATDVYFTSGGPSGVNGVSEVPAEGGAVDVLYASAQPTLSGPIAIDATRAYWADGSNSVWTMPLGGGAAITLAVGQNNVVAIAVDAASVYWLVNGNADTGQGSVMRLPLTAFDGQ